MQPMLMEIFTDTGIWDAKCLILRWVACGECWISQGMNSAKVVESRPDGLGRFGIMCGHCGQGPLSFLGWTFRLCKLFYLTEVTCKEGRS